METETAVVLLCVLCEKFKEARWVIPVPFQLCETLAEVLSITDAGRPGEKFHLFLFDETIGLDPKKFLSIDNVAGIEICYAVGYTQRIKHQKIRYTSIATCLFRWYHIQRENSQMNARRLAESGDNRKKYHQRKAQFNGKELMMVNDSHSIQSSVVDASLLRFLLATFSSFR